MTPNFPFTVRVSVLFFVLSTFKFFKLSRNWVWRRKRGITQFDLNRVCRRLMQYVPLRTQTRTRLFSTSNGRFWKKPLIWPFAKLMRLSKKFNRSRLVRLGVGSWAPFFACSLRCLLQVGRSSSWASTLSDLFLQESLTKKKEKKSWNSSLFQEQTRPT